MKSILLLSGGLDSAVLLCCFVPTETLCLSVDYGQPREELEAAKKMTEELGFQHKTVSIQGVYSKSSSGIFSGNDEIASDTVIPSRNAILISLAVGVGADEIYIGCNQDDQEDYPDCRRSFLRSIGNALGVTIKTPLISSTKKQIVDMSRLANISLNDFVSCYRGTNCGECFSCKVLLGAIK